MKTFTFFSSRNASSPTFPVEYMLPAVEMLITNQNAPSLLLKTPQGEEINTEEGFCNRTSPGPKGTSMEVRANHAEGSKSVHPCSRREASNQAVTGTVL